MDRSSETNPVLKYVKPKWDVLGQKTRKQQPRLFWWRTMKKMTKKMMKKKIIPILINY